MTEPAGPRRLTAVLALAALALTACVAEPAATPPASSAPASPSPSARSRPATAASPDFDGDGAPDLVVGVGAPGAGGVSVRYANGTALDLTRADLDGEKSYGFGQSLLAGDLNADGYTDLVVEDADESFDQPQALFFLFGSASGLQTAQAERVLVPGLTGGPLALVTRPARILAVSATDEDSGPVVLLYALGSDGLPKGDPDSVGGSAPDRFGSALAASGSLLVIGAPGQDVGWARGAGAIVVLRFRSATEYDTDGYTQDSADVPGDPQYEDHFGASLAAGDGYVVVGVPDDHDRDAVGGRVQPFQIGTDGLTPLPSLSQGIGDVPGKAERGDGFGRSVAMMHACPGVPGVLVGAPAEVVRGTVQAGSAWILPLAQGCTARQVFEEANGLAGGPVENALLGSAVTALRTAPDLADTAVLVAQGTSEEGVWGRVLTLPPPYTATTTALSDLHLGDDRRIVVSSPAG